MYILHHNSVLLNMSHYVTHSLHGLEKIVNTFSKTRHISMLHIYERNVHLSVCNICGSWSHSARKSGKCHM